MAVASFLTLDEDPQLRLCLRHTLVTQNPKLNVSHVNLRCFTHLSTNTFGKILLADDVQRKIILHKRQIEKFDPSISENRMKCLSEVPFPSEWSCNVVVDKGYRTPIRRNASGDIQCMSTNGQDCQWGDINSCNSFIARPSHMTLTCGKQHHDLYGFTGYDDINHWCYKACTHKH